MISIPSSLSLPDTPAMLPVLVVLVKATILLLLTLLGAAALRRASAGARHIVWTGALAGLVLLPVLSRWMPWRLAIVPSAVGTMLQTAQPMSNAEQSGQRTMTPPGVSDVPDIDGCTAPACVERLGRPLPLSAEAQASSEALGQPLPPSSTALGRSLTQAQMGAAKSSRDAGAARQFDAPVDQPRAFGGRTANAIVWPALFAVWLIGTLVLLARLLAGMRAVRGIVRNARSLDTPDWTAPLWEVADRLNLVHAPRLLCADDVSMPFACGFVHPTIVLPRDAEGWSDDRRRAVLFHELAHVRRRDLVGHTLGRVACALYWFHPLVWGAARRLRAESERACDDLVLACGTRASEYADHLLQIVTEVRHPSAPAVALAMARRKEFEGRMLAILDPELRRTSPSRLQAAGLVLGLAALAVSVSAMVPASRAESHTNSWERSWVRPSRPHSAGGTPAPTHPLLSAGSDGRDARPHTPAPTDSSVSAHETAAHDAPAPTRSAAGATTTRTTMPSVRVDTGEHRRAGSIDDVVSTVVRSTVEPVIHQTVEPVVDQTLESLFDGGRSLDLGIDSRTADGVRRTVHDAMRASFDGKRVTSSSRTDSDAVVLLARILRSDSDATVRRTAAWALAQRDERAATEPLAAALEHDKSADVREMAAWGLGHGDGGAAAVQALGDAVQRDADQRVKATAAWALGQIGDRAATPALDAALVDPSSRVRARAAWALGQIEPRSAPRGLVTALQDSSTNVRLTAAWALGQIEDPKTLSALSAALSKEKDKGVRQAELRAVLMLGDTSDAALRELLKSSDPDIRLRATRALAGYGTGAWPWPWPWPMPRPMP